MRPYRHILLIYFLIKLLPIYGINPGAREGAVGWFVNGKLWLFGGIGFAENSTQEGLLNDLWYFDTSVNSWTFVAGDRDTNADAVSGNVGEFNPSFRPEGLQHMCAWKDGGDRSLFIFGGERGGSKLNTVWQFNLAVNQWAVLNGTVANSPGNYNPPQFIGSRTLSKCLVVNTQAYVFAGVGFNSYATGFLHDLWVFDLTTLTWNWKSGIDTVDCSGTLLQNVPSTNGSFPPCQSPASAWLGPSQELMFAAGTTKSGIMNDMYRYTPTKDEWIWLPTSSSLTGRDYVGSASDGTGKAWIFGGEGEPFAGGSTGLLADLIEYNGTSFSYLKGSTASDIPGNYSTLGSGDANSTPGSRRSPVMWRETNGDLWLFGGYGLGDNATKGYLNDLWKYNYSNGVWTWVSGSKQINQRGEYLATSPVTPVTPPQSEPVAAPLVEAPVVPQSAPMEAVVAPVFPGQTDQILLGVLIPVGVIGAGLVVLFIMLRRRKKPKKQKPKEIKSTDTEYEGIQMSSSTTTTVNPTANGPVTGGTYSSITGNVPESNVAPIDYTTGVESNRLIPYSAVKLGREIGVGSYGKVYIGKLRTTQVAVKVANTNMPQDEFIREANFQLAIPPHPNIVQLLGISIDGPQPLVVLEYCNEGSLDKVLFDSDRLNTSAEQIALVEAIARGLDHLHQNNIVHRDLAVRNILLHHGEPKISDFGMSRKLKEASQVGKTANNIGPIRWMAPEALSQQLYSTKSDVWTFGILLYEIVARQEPHADDDLLTVGVKVRDEGYTPAIPENCPAVLRDIMQMCWKRDPQQRPEMSTICELLDKK